MSHLPPVHRVSFSLASSVPSSLEPILQYERTDRVYIRAPCLPPFFDNFCPLLLKWQQLQWS